MLSAVGLGRNRHMEFVPKGTARHQRHRVAGRTAHAAAGRAGEIPHADHVPGGAAVHQPGASRPCQRAVLIGPRCHLSRRA